MAYSAEKRISYERASKIGHLQIINSPWVQSVLKDFETNDVFEEDRYDKEIWQTKDVSDQKPLKHIWVADGSDVKVIVENYKELAYIKTALMNLDSSKIAKIDKKYPHPLLLQDATKDSTLYHTAVLPLHNIKSDKGNLYDTVRHIIYDCMRLDEQGQYYETLKWLLYKKWEPVQHNSPGYACPHCNKNVNQGFAYDHDMENCPHCGREVLLTDILGFHHEMSEDGASNGVAPSYMLLMEVIMLFTVIRLQWYNRDKSLLSDTLFIKDGPMVFDGPYIKLVNNIRDFFAYARKNGRTVHMISTEKSGAFFEHLRILTRFTKPDKDKIKYAVLNHGYIRKEISRMPEYSNPYGIRTNWGEKIFVIVDDYSHMVLNIPTGGYSGDDDYPLSSDLIGLDRILATLPSLVSRKYEGAIYPIQLVNEMASMSERPSAKILQNFTNDILAQKEE